MDGRLYGGSWSTPGSLTANAGTAISFVVPPKPGYKVQVKNLNYESGSTAHTPLVLKALAKTYLTAAAATSATSIVLASAAFRDQTLANGDYVVIAYDNGTYGFLAASALSTLTATVSALAFAAAANNSVWILGSLTEVEHSVFRPKVSVMSQYQDFSGAVAEGGFLPKTVASVNYVNDNGYGDPIVLYSGNATAASQLTASGVYSRL